MASSRKRPSRLGRGLSSLMAQSVPTTPPATESASEADGDGPAVATQSPAESSEGPAPVGQASAAPADGASDPDNGSAGTANAADSEPRPEDAGEARGDRAAEAEAGDGLRYIPVDSLRANPHQPRQHFDESALRRLADSVQADGLMQPIVVRPARRSEADAAEAGDGAVFEIVAGERRWRAATLAGLERVPAIVRELDEQALAEWALIENLQREDLNPIERAEAFQGLAQRFGLGHDEIAQRVGLERSTISNLLRLLQLSDFVKDCVREGALSMGQARAIAGVADAEAQRRLAERAMRQGLSVRQVEQLARQGGGNGSSGSSANSDAAEPTRTQVRSAYLADLEQQLAEQLQTRVKVRPGRKKGSGTLTIEFYTLDQFDALMAKLGVSASE